MTQENGDPPAGRPAEAKPRRPTATMPMARSTPAVAVEGAVGTLAVGGMLGQVRLVSRLGAGSMGVVFLGQHVALDRKVVVKTLHDAGGDEARLRFLEEARSAAQLSHPNVAQVFDAGCHRGENYLVMEYVEGLNLRALGEAERLDTERVVSVARGVARGLHAAHRLGIVHRDVKPENIMITRDFGVKLVDFGLAKRAGSAKLTAAHVVLGTPYFMAPEQVEAEEIDARADLYALGVTMFWLLSGCYPFDGEHPIKIMTRRLEEPAPSLAEQTPGLPPRLAALVDSLLARRREERPQSASEVLARLADPRLFDEDIQRPDSRPVAPPSSDERPAPAWRRPVAVASIFVLVTALGALALREREGRRGSDRSAPGELAGPRRGAASSPKLAGLTVGAAALSRGAASGGSRLAEPARPDGRFIQQRDEFLAAARSAGRGRGAFEGRARNAAVKLEDEAAWGRYFKVQESGRQLEARSEVFARQRFSELILDFELVSPELVLAIECGGRRLVFSRRGFCEVELGRGGRRGAFAGRASNLTRRVSGASARRDRFEDWLVPVSLAGAGRLTLRHAGAELEVTLKPTKGPALRFRLDVDAGLEDLSILGLRGKVVKRLRLFYEAGRER